MSNARDQRVSTVADGPRSSACAIWWGDGANSAGSRLGICGSPSGPGVAQPYRRAAVPFSVHHGRSPGLTSSSVPNSARNTGPPSGTGAGAASIDIMKATATRSSICTWKPVADAKSGNPISGSNAGGSLAVASGRPPRFDKAALTSNGATRLI